jgi:hypothetical protein
VVVKIIVPAKIRTFLTKSSFFVKNAVKKLKNFFWREFVGIVGSMTLIIYLQAAFIV